MNNKVFYIIEALFVVFLWSASKVLMKWGVEAVPPYFLVAVIQTISLALVAGYFFVTHKKIKLQPTKHEILAMVLGGIVAAGAANLFITIGLQYVTAGMAGLIAATSSVFGLMLAYLFLHERPKKFQYAGIALVMIGVYASLFNNVLDGALVGVALLVLAEVGFAFNAVVSRMIAVRHEEPTNAFITLVSNVVGVAVLVPTALLVDGFPVQQFNFVTWLVVAAVGVIFAVTSLMWNSVLDHLKVVEASILTNTLLIQVAILSVVFLHETISNHQIWGSLLVLAGALVVDGKLLFQRPRQRA